MYIKTEGQKHFSRKDAKAQRRAKPNVVSYAESKKSKTVSIKGRGVFLLNARHPGEGRDPARIRKKALGAGYAIPDVIRDRHDEKTPRVYDHETPAADPCWVPPDTGRPCPVLQLPTTEMAVFNQNAEQQRHYHKQATEIYVVVAGAMIIEIDGANHQMRAGDAVIIGPGVIHEIKNQGRKFTSYVIGANCGGPRDKIPA